MTFGAYRQIFQVRDFRLYWLGFTLSFLGDTMTRVALIWFVYERTRSADALGWLMLCYTGPIVVGGLLAGALLDRFERRRVIMVDSLVRGCAVALLPVLSWLGWLSPDDAGIVRARLEGAPWKAICWRFGISRPTADRRWRYGLGLIALRLNGQVAAAPSLRRMLRAAKAGDLDFRPPR